MCNFLHLKMVGKRLYRELHGRERPSLYSRRGGGGGYQRGRRNRSRSPAGYREETDEERRAKMMPTMVIVKRMSKGPMKKA